MSELWILLACALGAVVFGLLARRRELDREAIGTCGVSPEDCEACSNDCHSAESTDVRS